MSNPSAAQLQEWINMRGQEIGALHDLIMQSPPNDPMRAKMRARISMLENTRRDWKRRYIQKTGENPHYEYYANPVTIVIPKKAVQDAQKKREASASTAANAQRIRLKNLIQRGQLTYDRVKGRMDSLYQQRSGSITGQWIDFLGGTSMRVLTVFRTSTLPRVNKRLNDASAYVRKGNYSAAQECLTAAATDLLRMERELHRKDGQTASGARMAETAIGFYRDVTIGAVTGGAGLTAMQSIGVGTMSAATGEGVDLALRAIDGKENLSAKDFQAAAEKVAIAGVGAAAGQGFEKLSGIMARQLAHKIGLRVVAEFIRKNPAMSGYRREMLGKVTEVISKRIGSLASAQITKLLTRWREGKKEPDWNVLENLLAPMVDGGLGEVCKAVGREKVGAK